tara:strand:+ start:4032 stop:4442 length:411 start_codon:yes stop_codon:yes gene_type:complete
MEATERKVISLEYENEFIEQYHEIIDFFKVSFPEWTTHSGVGSMSSELISACREANISIYEDEELSKKEQLKRIYENAIKLYKYYREEYKLVFAQHCVDTFFDEHENFYNNKVQGVTRKKYQRHVDSLRYKTVFNY